MVYRSGATARPSFALICGVAMVALLSLLPGRFAAAQEATQTGTINGRVVDERGVGISGAQVFLVRPAIGSQTGADGNYSLRRVPAGTHTVGVRMLGFRPDSASVTVQAGGTATQDFTLGRDPLQLQEMVVTGTQSPRTNLDASVAVTTLSAQEVRQAAPRSTTEMLRYVPGVTRVESSGGEVNQNLVIRGILNQEFVMFMEDGMPVFPTMHTYFMNADNLFRFDENIDRMEVVRGGASALFGSNTPGAIINYINKTGGDRFAGTMRATAGTHALARYDLNLGGPMGEDWRFNAGGFYRYDHGVRDPGFPGIRGGQLKANVTRQLSNGYLRASVKHIDDRNQFILPLPLNDPDDPNYISGFSNYGALPQQRGRRHPDSDAGGRSDLAARQRPQNEGDLVHGGRVSGTGGRLALPEHRPGDAERPGAQCDRPGKHLHGRRLCSQSHEPGRFAPLSRGEHLPIFLHQPRRRRRQQAAVRYPERFRDSVNPVARRQAHLRDPGPVAAAEDLRPAHCGPGGVLRQLYPGQPLELHRHPHRRAGQPAIPGPCGNAPGRGAGRGHPERLQELPLGVPQRNGTDLHRERSARGRDPADRPNPGGYRRPGGIQQLRAERGDRPRPSISMATRPRPSITRRSATAASVTSPATLPTGRRPLA